MANATERLQVSGQSQPAGRLTCPLLSCHRAIRKGFMSQASAMLEGAGLTHVVPGRGCSSVQLHSQYWLGMHFTLHMPQPGRIHRKRKVLRDTAYHSTLIYCNVLGAEAYGKKSAIQSKVVIATSSYQMLICSSQAWILWGSFLQKGLHQKVGSKKGFETAKSILAVAPGSRVLTRFVTSFSPWQS